MWLLCILDEKVDEKWAHVNHNWSHPMKNDKQVDFVIKIYIIEYMCQILIVGVIICCD
jgi:hypothetical protein